MPDLYSNENAVFLIPAATYSADTTPASVDLRGYRSTVLFLGIGAGGITFSGSNKIEFVMTHSDDDSTYTNVADADVLGVTGITSGIVKSLVAAHASADITKIGYRGGKRYVKLLADFSGTHGTGTPISAVLVRGQAVVQPVT